MDGWMGIDRIARPGVPRTRAFRCVKFWPTHQNRRDFMLRERAQLFAWMLLMRDSALAHSKQHSKCVTKSLRTCAHAIRCLLPPLRSLVYSPLSRSSERGKIDYGPGMGAHVESFRARVR